MHEAATIKQRCFISCDAIRGFQDSAVRRYVPSRDRLLLRVASVCALWQGQDAGTRRQPTTCCDASNHLVAA